MEEGFYERRPMKRLEVFGDSCCYCDRPRLFCCILAAVVWLVSGSFMFGSALLPSFSRPSAPLWTEIEDLPPSYDQCVLPDAYSAPRASHGAVESGEDEEDSCTFNAEQSSAPPSASATFSCENRTTYRQKMARAGSWCLNMCLSLLD